MIGRYVLVAFCTDVNTNKTNLSQEIDYKDQSNDLGNFPRSYYVKFCRWLDQLKILELNKGHIQSLKTKRK